MIFRRGSSRGMREITDLAAYFAAPLTQPSQLQEPLAQEQETAESQELRIMVRMA